MRKAWCFKSILLVAAAVLLLPVGGLFLYQAWVGVRAAIAAAEHDSLDLAQAVASRVSSFQADAERTLRALAQRPQVRALDAAHCDPALRQALVTLPLFDNVAVMARDFTVICSGLPLPEGRRVSMAQFPEAARYLDHPGLFVHEPLTGPIVGRPVLVLSYPILGPDGRVAGRVGGSLAVENWQTLLEHAAHPDTTLAVLSRQGKLLARVPGAGPRVGTDVSHVDVVRQALQRGAGVTTTTGLDGTRKVFGFATVAGSGLHVYAGRPERAVLAPAYASAALGTGLFILAALLMGLFVLLLDRLVAKSVLALRAMAEALAQDNGARWIEPTGPRELRRAITAANAAIERRRESRMALRESEQRLRHIVRSANIGLWDWDLAGGKVHYSAEWKAQLGYADAEIGDEFDEWRSRVHPEDLARVEKHVAGCLAEPWPDYQVEFRLLHKDGSWRWIVSRGALLRGADGQPARLMGMHVDVTALRAAEARFRSLFEFAPDGILVVGTDDHYVDANPAACRMLGRTRDELVGRHPSEILLPNRIPDVEPAFAAVRAKQPHRRDWTLRRKDGSTFEVEIAGTQLPDGNIIGIVHDVTARHEAQRRMRALSRRLAEVHDAEQRRISGELHDILGQNLAALGINLKVIRAQLDAGGAAADAAPVLERSQQLLERSIAFTRTLISELRPPTLDDYGLLAGLRWYGAQVEATTGLATVVEGDEPVPRLARASELALFRIAQEALANTVRHAHAHSASLQLRSKDGGVVLTIADDGAGFQPDRPGAAGGSLHWGLLMMRERAAAIGAQLRTESAPGKGTRVVVELARAA